MSKVVSLKIAVQSEPYRSQKCVVVIHNLCTLLVILSVKNAVNEEELVVYIKIRFSSFIQS